RHGVEDFGGKDSEHGDGPAAPALGPDLRAWAERQSERTHLPPAPLLGRWHCRGWDHECPDGCEPSGPASATTEASASSPTAAWCPDFTNQRRRRFLFRFRQTNFRRAGECL